MSVTQGQSTSLTLTLTRTAFTSDVSLSATGAPAGVTVSFQPTSLTGTTLTTTVTFAASASAASGTSQIVLHATGDGVTEQTANISLTVNVAGSYSLGTAHSTVSVVQGGAGTDSVTVNRTGGFSGAVALTFSGVPTNVTVTPTPASVTGATSALAIAVGASVPTGNYVITVNGNSAGTTQQTTTFTLTVTAAAGASIALNPTSVSVGQGGVATDTITITRVGGFSSAVNLTATGLPTGVTATFDNSAPTGNRAIMTLAATGGATVGGPTTVTVHANATGISEATATVGVTVTTPTTTNFSLDGACIGDHPVGWLAVKNMNGAWQVVTPTNGVYSFSVTNAFQLAVMQTKNSGGSSLFVGSFTIADVSPLNGVACAARTGSSTYSGSVTASGSPWFGSVSIGRTNQQVNNSSPNYSLSNLPSTTDIVATLQANTPGFRPASIIVRHGATPGAQTTLDFTSGEAAAPVSGIYTIGALNSDSLNYYVDLLTVNQTAASIGGNFGASNVDTVYGAPSSILATTDVHDIQFMAQASSNANSARMVETWVHTPTNTGLTLRSALATPTVVEAATTPYVQYHVTLPYQTDYDLGAQVGFNQGNLDVQMFESKAYMQAVGDSQWDMTMPDLSSLSGFNNAWEIQTGSTVNWQVYAMGNSFGSMFTDLPADGAVQYAAMVQGSASTSAPRGTRLSARGSSLHLSGSARPSHRLGGMRFHR